MSRYIPRDDVFGHCFTVFLSGALLLCHVHQTFELLLTDQLSWFNEHKRSLISASNIREFVWIYAPIIARNDLFSDENAKLKQSQIVAQHIYKRAINICQEKNSNGSVFTNNQPAMQLLWNTVPTWIISTYLFRWFKIIQQQQKDLHV